LTRTREKVFSYGMTDTQTRAPSAYSVVGVILGSIAAASLVIGALAPVAILCAILGILSSLDGLSKARKGTHTGKTVAIVGLCLSSVTLGIYLLALTN
jgi:hypothetical protein